VRRRHPEPPVATRHLLGVAATRDDAAILAGRGLHHLHRARDEPPARGDHRLLPHSGRGQEHRHHLRSGFGLPTRIHQAADRAAHHRLRDEGGQLNLFIGYRTGIRLRSAGRRDGIDVESDRLDPGLGSHRLFKVGLFKVGRAELEPATNGLRVRSQRPRDQAKQLAETAQIACNTVESPIAGTVAVRPRHGFESPPDAGVTPG
jgi:hypothetical protein